MKRRYGYIDDCLIEENTWNLGRSKKKISMERRGWG